MTRAFDTRFGDPSYDRFPSDHELSMEHLGSTRDGEGGLRVRSADGATLIFDDALFNQPHLPGFGGWLLRLLGSTGGPKVTRIGRLFLARDKSAFRAHLERLADTPSCAVSSSSTGR